MAIALQGKLLLLHEELDSIYCTLRLAACRPHHHFAPVAAWQITPYPTAAR